jgi:hypothetical protein
LSDGERQAPAPLDFEKKFEDKIYTKNKNILKCGIVYIVGWREPGTCPLLDKKKNKN